MSITSKWIRVFKKVVPKIWTEMKNIDINKIMSLQSWVWKTLKKVQPLVGGAFNKTKKRIWDLAPTEFKMWWSLPEFRYHKFWKSRRMSRPLEQLD